LPESAGGDLRCRDPDLPLTPGLLLK